MVTPLRLVAGDRVRSIRVLGGFGLARAGQSLDTTGWPARPLTLLRLLAAHGGKVARDEVIDLLWPDSPPEAGGTNLRGLVHRLRRLLGDDPPPVLIQGGWVLLNPELAWEIDLALFEQSVHEAGEDAETLQRALALYTGEPLVEDRYEDWAVPIRERVQRTYREGVLRLAGLLRLRGAVEEIVLWLERLLESDPLDETVFRLLLEALSEAGRRGDIRRKLARFAERLKAELDVEPDEETIRLAERLAQEPKSLPAQVPRPQILVLPAQPTPFIGREQELGAITRLLERRGVRQVTLTGPGGSGKTRLAVEAAERMAAQFPDGICFVNLAPISDPDLVGPAMVAALQLPRSTIAPVEQLTARLRRARALLVLDNCEQVLDSATLIADLLTACPDLKVLATSREILRLRAEYEYPVPPLSLPPREAGPEPPDPAELSRYDSIIFFLDRASAARADFTLTPSNATTVTAICRRLDGIPLALELAAARTRIFTPDALLERLDGRLAVLTDGPRDLPDRQQTLRAAIDWSYRLLRPSEQTLLARLAVFAGGWTMEAAETICSVDGDLTVLADLASLVEKSLVRREESGRFIMLETLREYATERLIEQGDGTLRDAHARYFQTLAERAAPELTERGQSTPLEHLEAEFDNLRAALDWWLRSGRIAETLATATACEPFWNARGPRHEGVRWLEQALERAEDIEPAVRARAVRAKAALLTTIQDVDSAAAALQEALNLFDRLGDGAGRAEVLLDLSRLAIVRADYAQASRHAEEALRFFEECGDVPRTVDAVFLLGTTAIHDGRLDIARRRLEEALSLMRSMGGTLGLASTLLNLGYVAMQEGSLTEAEAYLEEALAIAEAGGQTGQAGHALMNLSELERRRGNYSRAAELLTACLDLKPKGQQSGMSSKPEGQQSGVSTLILCLLRITILLATETRDWERAALLAGAEEGLRTRAGIGLSPEDREEMEQVLNELRIALGDAAMHHAWEHGQLLDVEEALTRMRDICRDVSRTGAESGQATPIPDRERSMVAGA